MRQIIGKWLSLFLPFLTNRGAGGFLPQENLQYKAKMTQATTAAPAEGAVLKNSMGAAMTWARTGAGVYTCTAASAVFVVASTVCRITSEAASGAANTRVFSYVVTSTTVVTVSVADAATPTAADSGNFYIEIDTPFSGLSS